MGLFSDAVRSEVGSYDNSEWSGIFGETPVTIYAKPLTAADFMRLGAKHAGFMTQPSLEGMVDLIIMKAKDANGVTAFDKGDKPIMLHMASNRIGEIFGALFGEQMEMLNEGDEASEERAKN